MAIPELKDFYLVGGTCLSLRYGHRISVDLDLFSTTDFNIDETIALLERTFEGFTYRNTGSTIGIFGFIDGVKVDLVKHHYFKQIDTPTIEDGIRLYGDRDIMAMKVFAILKRAQKKDFWDVAELLKHYSLNDFNTAYNDKYPNHQVAISIPYAITYFADADESEDPISLQGQTWASVKKAIQQQVSEYLR
jgi:predicted nucleotidyltransferase component of viral defense system